MNNVEDLFKIHEINFDLNKSIFCESFLENNIISCDRNTCKNAHSLDELVPAECVFGKFCQRIENKTETCKCIHPEESKDELLVRILNCSLTNKILASLNAIKQKNEEKKEEVCKDVKDVKEEKDDKKEEKETPWNKILREEREGVEKKEEKFVKYSKPCLDLSRTGVCNKEECNYAHSIEQLNPVKCRFGDECMCDKICKFIHSNETKEEYSKRLGFFEDAFKTVRRKEKNPKFSRFCYNIIKYGKCTRDICTFAHSIKQLKPIYCHFENCRKLDCYFLHREETFENYLFRNSIPQS